MKKTILAAAVAMSFAGFAQAELILNETVEAQSSIDVKRETAEQNFGDVKKSTISNGTTNVTIADAQALYQTSDISFDGSAGQGDQFKHTFGGAGEVAESDYDTLNGLVKDSWKESISGKKENLENDQERAELLAEAKAFAVANKDSDKDVYQISSSESGKAFKWDETNDKVILGYYNASGDFVDSGADTEDLGGIEGTELKNELNTLTGTGAGSIKETQDDLAKMEAILASAKSKLAIELAAYESSTDHAYKAVALKRYNEAKAKVEDVEKLQNTHNENKAYNRVLKTLADTDVSKVNTEVLAEKDLDYRAESSTVGGITQFWSNDDKVVLSIQDQVTANATVDAIAGVDKTDSSGAERTIIKDGIKYTYTADGTNVAVVSVTADDQDLLDTNFKTATNVHENTQDRSIGFAVEGVVANNKAIVKTAEFANENRVKINTNTAAIAVNSDRLDGHDVILDNHEERISSNTANIEKLEMNFADLSADFYEFKEVASKGIAGVAAMAQIDSVYAEVGEAFVGAGVGSFNGEGAVAVGVGYRYSQALSVRAAGSFASGDAEPVIAAGMTYTFK